MSQHHWLSVLSSKYILEFSFFIYNLSHFQLEFQKKTYCLPFSSAQFFTNSIYKKLLSRHIAGRLKFDLILSK